ncbi:MAG: glycosyltransferase family 4 protein [Hyphomicrobium sp.]
MMRILIATDAWLPQVNGVVRTYERIISELVRAGDSVSVLSPSDFASVPLPIYPEIRLSLPRLARIKRLIEAGAFDAIHIATEGPIGLVTRRACRQLGRTFTTSYHTRFPEYAEHMLGIPATWSRIFMRRFHNSGIGTFAATPSLQRELEGIGFRRILPWSRGVDTDLFRPSDVRMFGRDRPVLLYCGRVSIEKNIAAFLSIETDARKVVVGDGPLLATLRASFPDVTYTGALKGADLAAAMASADVFVFPSRTDTFGLVMLEAMACGVPVAAYPVTGPKDVIAQGVSGWCDDDLGRAIAGALTLDRAQVRAYALPFTWAAAAHAFKQGVRKAHAFDTAAARRRAEARLRARRKHRGMLLRAIGAR